MLSVIVTFYDETAFLRTALTSVLNQQIDDLDVVLVNDNPEKFPESRLRDLTSGFNVRILQHSENLGLSAARNSGIAAAKGTHIAFLDADDYFTVGGLKKHFNYAIETDADLTHAATYLGHEGSVHAVVLQRDKRMHLHQRVVSGRMIAEETQFIVSSWASIYRADFLKKNALSFDVEQRKFEDRLFVLNAVTAARKVAFLGEAVRVWRRRANSISSSTTTPETHLLQVQLLEKCMAHMRAEVADQGLATRYEKRELFNSVSRLIWDMDIIAPLAANHPDYAEMGQRIQTLLGSDRFGQPIFEDPMVRAISRVGYATRRGLISRTDFFSLHKFLRTGDFAAAQALLDDRAAKPARSRYDANHPHKRLILHIGLHKTGTTFIQHHLLHHREALRRAGVLVPQTGFDATVAGRPGALSGHQGLVRAIRQSDTRFWKDLHIEIANSPARTVLISAENLGFPTVPDREALIEELFFRLGTFAQIDVVALARAPQTYVEAFHSEWVASAHPSGARGLEETLVDHTDRLTNFPNLFGPFEAATNSRVQIGDFDQMRRDGNLWTGFCALARLPGGLEPLDLPRYPTPDRASVRLLQLLNITVSDRGKRQRLMDTFFASPNVKSDPLSLLSPEVRLTLIDQFEATSAQFASERGFSPDYNALRNDVGAEDWHPLEYIPVSQLEVLLDVAAQIAGETSLPQTMRPQVPASEGRGRYEIVLRPRPWAIKLLDAFHARKDDALNRLFRRNR